MRVPPDFDFLFGRWRVRHRRLVRRLASETRWEEFDGDTDCRPLLCGLGNMDENRLELPSDAYEAVTLRLFDPGMERWSIWWIDGRHGRLEPPVHGSFSDGVGTFFGEDAFEGRPITVRFIWSGIGPDAARWEQAFSPDGGASWETNWIMQFGRAG